MLRVQSRESRQQRRVNVKNPVRELPQEMAAQDAQIAGEAHQVRFILAEFLDQLPVVDFTIEPARWKRDRVYATFARESQPRRLAAIRNDNRDLGIQPSLGDRIRDGDKIRPAAGDQNAEPSAHGYL